MLLRLVSNVISKRLDDFACTEKMRDEKQRWINQKDPACQLIQTQVLNLENFIRSTMDSNGINQSLKNSSSVQIGKLHNVIYQWTKAESYILIGNLGDIAPLQPLKSSQ